MPQCNNEIKKTLSLEGIASRLMTTGMSESDILKDWEYKKGKDINHIHAARSKALNPKYSFGKTEFEISMCEVYLKGILKKKKVIKCIGCDKQPYEILEFITLSEDEGMTPEEFVMQEEGTYNAFKRYKFYCTDCYIKAGMPLKGGK